MPEKVRPNWIIFLLATLLLVTSALNRVFVEATEYSRSSAVWIQVAIDAGLVIGILGLRGQLMRTLPDNDPRRGWITPLMIAGLVAGAVIFAIRFSSKEGWWTGHLHYNCCR